MAAIIEAIIMVMGTTAVIMEEDMEGDIIITMVVDVVAMCKGAVAAAGGNTTRIDGYSKAG